MRLGRNAINAAIVGAIALAVAAACWWIFETHSLAKITGAVLAAIGLFQADARKIVSQLCAVACRKGTSMSNLNISSVLSSLDLSNPGAAIDTAIRNFVSSKIPTVDAKTQPALAAAVANLESAAITAAETAFQAYALSKLEAEGVKLIGPVLASLATKFPVLAPEISALQSKLATL